MFWYNNPNVLFDKKLIFDIFPHQNYGLDEKLNAILRFSIYYTLIILIIKFKSY